MLNLNPMKKMLLLPGGQIPTYRFLKFFILAALFLSGASRITAQTGPTIIHIPAWSYPGEINLDSTTFYTPPLLVDSSYVVQAGPELIGISYQDQVLQVCEDTEMWRLERIRSFIDWNTYDVNAPNVELPLLDIDNDGKVGDGYDVALGNDSIRLVENGLPTRALGPHTNGLYQYVQNAWINTELLVYGRVFVDSLVNCTLDAGEQTINRWTVKIIGQGSGTVYTTKTNAQGWYFMAVCPEDDVVEVSLDVPFNYGNICPTVHTVTLSPGTCVEQNIPVALNSRCPLMSVDLGNTHIRPCFPGGYQVLYCNLSDQTIPDAHVEITLDPALTYTNSTIPGGHLFGNTYGFLLGDIAPGYCGTFTVVFNVSCELPPQGGSTLCSSAHIFPDSVCITNGGWSGASLQASAVCDGDSVRLAMKNVGTAPMSAPLDFVIVEDLVMYMQSPFQLNTGESTTVATVANSATWRIEAPQESAHPWGGTVSAFVEGCGGINEPGLGLAFALDSPNPFESYDCTVTTSSYDPNDKQAVPIGYGAERYIKPNTELEYKIRFQNTGTDTAFNIVILDTLSTNLDAASIVPGASSHHYDFDLLPGNVLRFQFDNINLLDSTTNLDASQGFFKYRVRQLADLPDYSQIWNRAAIYFDYNPPVMTNYTYHQVKRDFLEISAVETPGNVGKLRIFPNPVAGEARLEWPTTDGDAWFVLTDALGRTLRTVHTNGSSYRFERAGLGAGLYYFTIRTDAGQVYAGKVTLK